MNLRLCNFSRALFTTLSQLRIFDTESEFDVSLKSHVVGTRTGDGGFILDKDSESLIQTTHDNCPEIENYWSQKYNEKMKK